VTRINLQQRYENAFRILVRRPLGILYMEDREMYSNIEIL
jgi:hypothetical protein